MSPINPVILKCFGANQQKLYPSNYASYSVKQSDIPLELDAPSCCRASILVERRSVDKIFEIASFFVLLANTFILTFNYVLIVFVLLSLSVELSRTRARHLCEYKSRELRIVHSVTLTLFASQTQHYLISVAYCLSPLFFIQISLIPPL